MSVAPKPIAADVTTTAATPADRDFVVADALHPVLAAAATTHRQGGLPAPGSGQRLRAGGLALVAVQGYGLETVFGQEVSQITSALFEVGGQYRRNK